MRNRYAGTCCYCGEHVKVRKGHFERNKDDSGWRIIHVQCCLKRRKERWGTANRGDKTTRIDKNLTQKEK